MAAAAKWASFIVSQVVWIIHKCASSWPTNLINVQWANFSYLIMILSIFSHGSEKKLVGVLRGLTNQPYVRKSTCDTPLAHLGISAMPGKPFLGGISCPLLLH